MPLSVCVFLNKIRSAASHAVGESVMYRTCFLDFNAFTLSRASLEAHSPKAAPVRRLAPLPAEASRAYACQRLPAS